ncbi:PAS domain S-box protein [Myxococcota bacterium]
MTPQDPTWQSLMDENAELRRRLEQHEGAELERGEAEARDQTLPRTLAQALPEAIVMADRELRITYASKRAVELFGYDTAQELMVHGAFELLAPEDRPAAQLALQRTLEPGVGYGSEYCLVRKDGSRFPGEVNAVVIRDARGEPEAFLAVVRDVSERHRQQELLRVQRDLALTLSSVSDFDQALRVCLEAAMRVSGMDAGGVYGVDEQTQELKLLHSTGLSSDFVHQVSFYSMDAPSARLVRAGQALYVQYRDLGVPLDEARLREGLRAIAVVPILNESRALACLNVASHEQDEITPMIREALETLASQVASAVVRIQAEERLKQRESQYRLLADNLADVVWTTDMDLQRTYVSPSVLRQRGFTPEQVLSQTPEAGLTAESRQKARTMTSELLSLTPVEYHRSLTRELDQLHRDGSIVPTEVTASLLLDEQGRPCGILGVTRDISERRRAAAEKRIVEEQLLQTQKMEAIGTLAGGIAHDFNNLLTAILGGASLVRTQFPPGCEIHEDLRTVERAALQASELTHQLLGFARRGKLTHELVDLHQVIADVIAILRHTIDKRVRIQTNMEASTASVMGDPSQLRQVILNLAVNANDAMPGGGTLAFRTSVAALGESGESVLELAPGSYLVVSLADTGTGIPNDLRARIFEPFFTTKGPGAGTGMGLAVVYGIVQNHGGAIKLQTEPTLGSVFAVYLPLARRSNPPPDQRRLTTLPPGAGRILLVEDEELVRHVATRILGDLGYEVVVACNGREAVSVFGGQSAPFDLVMLDLGMPVMGGRECFRALQKADPLVRVLVCTGHAAEGEAQELLTEGAIGVLQKPYTKGELAKTLAGLLCSFSRRG